MLRGRRGSRERAREREREERPNGSSLMGVRGQSPFEGGSAAYAKTKKEKKRVLRSVGGPFQTKFKLQQSEQ